MTYDLCAGSQKDCSVESFHLPVGLGIVRGGVHVVYVQLSAYILEEFGCKLLPNVGDQVYGLVVMEDPNVDKVLGHLCRGYGLNRVVWTILVNRSTMKIRYRLPCGVRMSSPRIWMHTD